MAETTKGNLEAYVFIHELAGESPRRILEAFAGQEGVRFAAQFVGSFVAFGAVEVPDLRRLHQLMAGGYWDAGVRSEWSVLVEASTLAVPKRGSPPYCALVRADTRGDPRDVLHDLDDYAEANFPANSDEFRYAAAVVNGNGFGLLVEFGSTSLDGLYGWILDHLRPFDGIASTDSSFAFLPDNQIPPA